MARLNLPVNLKFSDLKRLPGRKFETPNGQVISRTVADALPGGRLHKKGFKHPSQQARATPERERLSKPARGRSTKVDTLKPLPDEAYNIIRDGNTEASYNKVRNALLKNKNVLDCAIKGVFFDSKTNDNHYGWLQGFTFTDELMDGEQAVEAAEEYLSEKSYLEMFIRFEFHVRFPETLEQTFARTKLKRKKTQAKKRKVKRK